MTTERLEEFRLLASILNYSKTAEKLFISQSVLSRHIRELESEIGVTLFFRDTHGVSLTDEGKYFLKWVEPLLDKANHTITTLANEHGREGRIRIICAEQTLNTHILTFLRGFQANYPDIDLQLSPVASTSKKETIFNADIVLSPCDFTNILLRDTEAVFLCAQEPLLAIPPMHHFGGKPEVKLEELKGETLIVPFSDEMFSPYPRNALLASRKCHDALHRVSAESAEAALLMVELGAGVMLIPHHLKHRVYSHTRTIPVTDSECAFPIFAYRNRAVENNAAALFFDNLREEFRNDCRRPPTEAADPRDARLWRSVR